MNAKTSISHQFVRRVENDIEFFTNEATGESGISVSGLARLCGVSHPAIIQLSQALVSKSPSEWLEPLVGMPLTLVSNASSSDPKLRNAKIIRDEACAHIITHYAFMGKETARYSLTKFAAIGVRTWIQGITQPAPPKAAPPKALKPDSKTREEAKLLIVAAWQQWVEQEPRLKRDAAFAAFAECYSGQALGLPEWVYEAVKGFSQPSLCRWGRGQVGDKRGANRRGKSKIAQHPKARELLMEALATTSHPRPCDAHALLEQHLPGQFTRASVSRFLRRWRQSVTMAMSALRQP
jgi:hypothetical protein